jgi:glycosyltransferase involved in cell wall biosynthesis
MKVVHIITNFEGIGGAELMLVRLLNAQPDLEHTVISLRNQSEKITSRIDDAGIKVFHLKSSGLLSLILGSIKLRQHLAELTPDVIVCWMYHANVVGLLASYKMKHAVIWNVRHSLDDISKESISTKLALYPSVILSRFANGIIYCAAKAKLQHEKFGFSNRNALVIPNGFNPVARRLLFQKSDEFVIGIAARFHPAKSYETFFEFADLVVAKHPGVSFILAGRDVTYTNSSIKELIGLSQITAGQIELLGEVLDMESFYERIDLLVLTSITEGFPNVLVEAMLNGVPVASTDVGDALDIINDENYVVPPYDPTGMANIAKNIINMNDSEYEKLSRLNYESVRNRFGMKASSLRYVDFWRRTILALASS